MLSNALKYIFPQKVQTMAKNGKKWPKIANNCKISEINKYGEKMQNMYKNAKNE